MGFLTGGPYYDLIGRTGNNVGRKVKGKNVFSMRPSKSSKQPTTLQRDQRTKFGMVTAWMSNALNIVQIGFQHYESTGSAMNSAVRRTLQKAVIGVSPNFNLDYSKVDLSRGPLMGSRNWDATSSVTNEIELTWRNQISSGKQKPTDKLVIFGYVPLLMQFVELIGPVAREAQTYNLILPEEFSGQIMHLWIYFMSAEGDLVSNSQHTMMTVV
jgi:hypothetical protein